MKSEYKSRITTLENEIGLLSNQVSTGYEMREYVCAYRYDHPTKGRKSLYRVEPPQDLICEEEMTIADRQTILESIEKEAADEQAKAGKPTEKVPVAQTDLLNACLAGAKLTRDDDTGFIIAAEVDPAAVPTALAKVPHADLLRFHDWLTSNLETPGAMGTDSVVCDVLAEYERRAKAEKAAPKRRQSASGVVACESDGKDLSDPDDRKTAN